MFGGADSCVEICGNGRRINVNQTNVTKGMTCDDANVLSGDGCDSLCQVEKGWTCCGGNLTSRDICTEICGDGLNEG